MKTLFKKKYRPLPIYHPYNNDNAQVDGVYHKQYLT